MRNGNNDWSDLVKRYRLRHGLSQARLGGLFGVSQRTISRWERGDDLPSLEQQKRLRDLGWELPGSIIANMRAAVWHCPVARALSRTQRLNLQAVSAPALRKRPSVADLVGTDLAPFACGILEEMLDDRALQASIGRREISCVLTTTRSVLRTAEHPRIGTWHTVITYFYHEGTLYSDAVSERVPRGTQLGYRAVAMDEVVGGVQVAKPRKSRWRQARCCARARVAHLVSQRRRIDRLARAMANMQNDHFIADCGIEDEIRIPR